MIIHSARISKGKYNIHRNNNDNNNINKVTCEMVKCPDPYMGMGVQPGAPPDGYYNNNNNNYH